MRSARSAFASVLGADAEQPRLIAAGRTSEAWETERAGRRWIARVPRPDPGRAASYRSEARIGRLLRSAGHPVADWTIVDVDGRSCAVAEALDGIPIADGGRFTRGFAAGLAGVLRDLHRLPAIGFGPLDQRADGLIGTSSSPGDGVRDRWRHAAIWPFDGSTPGDHPLARLDPDLLDRVVAHRGAIEAAAFGPVGVVHSDLHHAHLLQGPDGALTGLLDFGDAFLGSPAWDFALLHWYHGAANTELVAREYGPSGAGLSADGRTLALAVGAYKVAKRPADGSTVERLHALLATPDAGYADPRQAALYDRFEGERDDLDAYESIVDELGARSVLDVGCGTGVFALRLAERGLDVTGVDPAAASLEVARSKPGAERVRWIDGEATAVPPAELDLATMTGNVAQAVLTDAHWTATLGSIGRALRPGGHLVFETRVPERRAWEGWTAAATHERGSTAAGASVETWCDVLAVDGPFVTFRWTTVIGGEQVLTSDSTLRFWTRSEIERSLTAAGLAVIDVRDAPDRPGRELVFIARRP